MYEALKRELEEFCRIGPRALARRKLQIAARRPARERAARSDPSLADARTAARAASARERPSLSPRLRRDGARRAGSAPRAGRGRRRRFFLAFF